VDAAQSAPSAEQTPSARHEPPEDHEPPEEEGPAADDGLAAVDVPSAEAQTPEEAPSATEGRATDESPVIIEPPAAAAGAPPPSTKRRPLKRKQKAPALPGRDPIWARALVVLGIVLVLLSTTAITTSRILAHRYDTAVTKQNLLAPEARVTGPAEERRSTITGPLNFLLIGSDLRANNPEDGQRSDTIIIVHIPASLDRAYLISIPRDLRVRIPPFADTGFRGSHEKINGAFQYGGGGAGGVQLLSQTLTNLVGVRFDGAAIIDFSGFQKAVELLGGVHMCIDVRTESHHIGYDKNGNFLAPYDGPDGEHRNRESTPKVYEVGCRHLAAWEALDYVRQRKSLPDGDYGRQRHQQQFLRAVFDRAQAKNLTSNPIELDRFIRAIGESLTVDTNGAPIDELLFGLRNVDPNHLMGLQVPSAPEMIGGISYIIEKPESEDLYAALRDDTLDSWVVENPTWVNRI
jgi:LCP family protein required for cell wall assembly